MRKGLAILVAALMFAGVTLAQDPPPPDGGGQLGPGNRRGQGQGRHQRMQGIGQMFKTMHALRAISRELTEEQKAKFEEAMAKLSEKMTTIQQEFETDLSGILTPEQLQKFQEAKEAGFGGRGRRGGEGGPGQGRRGGEGQGQGRRGGEDGPEGGQRDRGQMLKRMDADGDGNITKDEFRGPEQLFDRLDTDKDGTISKEEAEAMGQGRRRRPEGGGRQEF